MDDKKASRGGSDSIINNIEHSINPHAPDFGRGNSENPAEEQNTGDYRGKVGQEGRVLGAAEKAAENGTATSDDQEAGATESAKQAENQPGQPSGGAGGYFTGSGKAPAANGKNNIFSRMNLKKSAPLGIIGAFLSIVCLFVVGGQATMPFSFLEQLRDLDNSLDTSNVKRSNRMMTRLLRAKDLKNPLHQKILGGGGAEFKIKEKQRLKLREQGIYVVDDVGPDKTSVMLFDDGSGELKVVAADSEATGKISAADLEGIDLSRIDAGEGVDLSKMKISAGQKITFLEAMTNIADFRNGYIAGSRTWRGSVGAWFDDITVRFLKNNDILRNRFKDYRDRVEAEANGNTRSAKKKVVAEELTSEAKDRRLKQTWAEVEKDPEEVDEEGNAKESLTSKEDEISLKRGDDVESIKEKIRNFAKNSKAGSGVANAVVGGACAVFDVIGAINLAIAAEETAQVLQVASGYLEMVDKVKAGDGNDSPIGILSESMTEQHPTMVYDEEGNASVAEGKENTSAMNSDGVAATYQRRPANINDASVQNISIASRFNNIAGALGTSQVSFMGCTAAKIGAAIFDAVVEAISRGAWSVIGTLISLGAGGMIALGIEQAIKFIIPIAVATFTRDLLSNLGGEDLGNMVVSGSLVYMGGNHLKGGGSPMSRTKLAEFAMAQREVLAEKAQFERETLSPFDTSSQYTFLGTILSKMAVLQTVRSPMLDGLSAVSSMISRSVSTMLPTATAVDLTSLIPTEEEYENSCPYLASIGVAGDSFCTPYMGSDMDTMDVEPEDVVDQVEVLDGKSVNLDEETGEVVPNSNLDHYIKFCSNRTSPFGVIDGTIAGNFMTGSTGNSVVDGALGTLPDVGDLLEIAGDLNQWWNMDWITGKACVASDSEDADKNDKWKENKIYQRLLEDQRMLQILDENYTSPILAAMEEAQGVISEDDSTESVIAKYTGLTLDQAEDVLAVIEYSTYIAYYDPSERYAFGSEEVNVQGPLNFDDRSEVQIAHQDAGWAVIIMPTIYADVRNRTVTV